MNTSISVEKVDCVAKISTQTKANVSLEQTTCNEVQYIVVTIFRPETGLFHNQTSDPMMTQFIDLHYDDVIMGTIASQITSLTIVYSTVYSGANQSKHQSSASLAFVWGIHRGPVNSPHKWPVTRKMFPFDDVIMIYVLPGYKWLNRWGKLLPKAYLIYLVSQHRSRTFHTLSVHVYTVFHSINRHNQRHAVLPGRFNFGDDKSSSRLKRRAEVQNILHNMHMVCFALLVHRHWDQPYRRIVTDPMDKP